MTSADPGPAEHRIIQLRGPQALRALGADLDGLFDAIAAPTTAKRIWLEAWAQAFTTWTPWAIGLRRGDQLVGAALLATRRRLHHTLIVPIGDGPSDYLRLPALDAAASEALAAGLVRALSERRDRWRLVVPQLPVGDPVAAQVAHRLPHAEIVPGDPSPVLRWAPGTTLRSLLTRKAWKNLSNRRNRLEREASSVTIEYASDPSTVRALLPEFERVRARRDRQMSRAEDMASPKWKLFLDAALPALAEAGELEIGVLRIDGQCAAYGIALLDGPSYRRWQGRIDPTFAAYAPGRLLNAAMIERVLADTRFNEYDYMRGDEPYKLSLSNETIVTERLHAWSTQSLQVAERYARAWQRRLRRLRDDRPSITASEPASE